MRGTEFDDREMTALSDRSPLKRLSARRARWGDYFLIAESGLSHTSPEGEMLSSGAFILRPRSFVVVGSQAELTGSTGGPLADRVRSFELFRRNLYEPEVITFDELVARAEWHLAEAEIAADDSDAYTE
jgi:hypothetical protein